MKDEKIMEFIKENGEEKLKKNKYYWKHIAEELSRVRNQELIKLVRTLRPIPKTVWLDDFDRIMKDIDILRETLQRKANKYGVDVDFW